uniref:CD63 antigen-like n=1 Tax=Poecilia latipinna TaxID=48699 RepID=A0A3B3W1X5_9TELE
IEGVLLLVFRFVLQASGVALITIGALQYSTYSQIGTFAGSGLSKIAIVLIAVGAVIALVSILGHCGAFLNNSTMVSCFICILIIIILLEIFTGAAFYIFRSRVRQFKSFLQEIIFTSNCCGADTYTDWSRSVGWGNHEAVPDSCCPEKREGCGHDKDKAHKKVCSGCISAIKLFLLKNLVWVGGVCIVFGVIVGVCLCLNIKRKNYENVD